MEKADIFSFPAILGSGGRGAREVKMHPCAALHIAIQWFSHILIPSHSYQTLRVDSTADSCVTLSQQLTTMADTMEIAPNDTIPVLPPLPGVAPLVHAPRAGDGQI